MTDPADELADLVSHDSEMRTGQRSQQLVQSGAVLHDVLEQSVRAKQTAKDRLDATALDTARPQRHVVTEDCGTHSFDEIFRKTGRLGLEAPRAPFTAEL